MAVTRSVNKAIAAVQGLAADFAHKINELAQYLRGLVTSQAPDWMDRVRGWTRWILERMRDLCQRLAWAVGCKRSSLANSGEMREAISSATEDALKAVHKAMQLTGNLIHEEDLYGDGLQQAEELYEVLEETAAKILELQYEIKTDDDKEVGEDKNDDEDDEPSPKMMRLS